MIAQVNDSNRVSFLGLSGSIVEKQHLVINTYSHASFKSDWGFDGIKHLHKPIPIAYNVDLSWELVLLTIVENSTDMTIKSLSNIMVII